MQNNRQRPILFSSLVRGGGWVLFLSLIFLGACTNNKGKVRIRGEFENLPQADLLLYSPDGGLTTIDTLHILQGEFDYRTPVTGKDVYTWVIIYPNFSTLSFQAHAGCDVRIKGDALSLSQVKVEGADSIIPNTVKKSPMVLKVGKKLPASKIVKQKKGKYLFITFWARWCQGTSNVNYYTRQALKEHPDSLHAFTYSLDIAPEQNKMGESIEDSTRWTTYCDYSGWGGPLLTKYGIRNLPLFILVNPKGIITAMGNNYTKDIKPEMEKIGKKEKP